METRAVLLFGKSTMLAGGDFKCIVDLSLPPAVKLVTGPQASLYRMAYVLQQDHAYGAFDVASIVESVEGIRAGIARCHYVDLHDEDDVADIMPAPVIPCIRNWGKDGMAWPSDTLKRAVSVRLRDMYSISYDDLLLYSVGNDCVVALYGIVNDIHEE